MKIDRREAGKFLLEIQSLLSSSVGSVVSNRVAPRIVTVASLKVQTRHGLLLESFPSTPVSFCESPRAASRKPTPVIIYGQNGSGNLHM